MKVLLARGSGNLGQALVPKLLDQGDTPVILNVRAPPLPLNEGTVFIKASVLDRSLISSGHANSPYRFRLFPVRRGDRVPRATQRLRVMSEECVKP
jgi:hypothetical protein